MLQFGDYLYYIDATGTSTSSQNVIRADIDTQSTKTTLGTTYWGTMFTKGDYVYLRYTSSGTSIVFRAYNKNTGAYTSGQNITVTDASWGKVPHIWDTNQTTNKWNYLGVRNYGDTGLYMIYRNASYTVTGVSGYGAEPVLIVGDLNDIEGSLVKVLYGAGIFPSAYTVNGETWIFSNQTYVRDAVLGGDSNNVYISKDTSSGTEDPPS